MQTTSVTITTTQCPKNTPWGRADYTKQLAPGIWTVGTPSHGGMWIAPELYATMPESIRETRHSHGGWFEEDCDWAIPVLFFWDLLEGFYETRCEEVQTAAIMTLKSCYDGKVWALMVSLGIYPDIKFN